MRLAAIRGTALVTAFAFTTAAAWATEPPDASAPASSAPSPVPSAPLPPTVPASADAGAPAHGDDPAARSAELKKQGDEEMETLHYAEAAETYAKAYELAPTAALLYNRARALQAIGELGDALTLFERFSTEAPPEIKARVHGFDKLVADVRAHVTTLSIRCNVGGAVVRLYGRSLGTTPVTDARVNAGTATLEVSADGYFPVRRELELRGGAAADVDLQLESKQISGILAVTSPIVGAVVSVDGRELGRVPLETTLAAGMHSVLLRHDGYLSLKTDTVVTAGERKDLEIPLEKEASIVTHWWFWTAIGVVVAGGVVTTVALTSSRAPDKGSIAPGTVSSPLATW